jgi:hypothetical protein
VLLPFSKQGSRLSDFTQASYNVTLLSPSTLQLRSKGYHRLQGKRSQDLELFPVCVC